MKRIDITQWKEFKVGEYFDASNTGNILVRDIDDGSGSTPYITASGVNNGLVARIDASKYDKIRGNCILIGGKTFTLTYQREDFVSNDSHNIELHLKDRDGSESLYLFIITALRCAFSHKYQWGDAVTKPKLLEQQILLPSKKDHTPDWPYMEAYMQRIEQRARQTVASLSKLTGGGKRKRLNISEWREFKVGELFDIRKPEVYHSREVTEQAGGIPYVVRSKFNNGMSLRVNAKTIKTLNPAGVISFGSENSTFFYQQEPWCSGRDIYYIDTQALPKYACFFLASCLQQIGQRYTYSYGLFPDLLRQEKIKLPVLASGTPDWPYMEAYMQALQAQAAQRLAAQQGSINL